MIELIKNIYTFFDKLEDKVRGHLSNYPIIYTLIGGTALVLFWRGVWHTADILQAKGGWLEFIFYEPNNLIITTVILLLTGLFVSYFIGDTILMSGLRKQKKTTERTEKEIVEEEEQIKNIGSTVKEMKKEIDGIGAVEKEVIELRDLKKDIDELKEIIEHEHAVHHPNEKRE
jgi:hypothetical protein